MRAPRARTRQVPFPAPTITCFASGGQWTKSHCRSGRSSPSMTSVASPERTRKSCWSDSQWYIAIGSPVGPPPRLPPPQRDDVDPHLLEVGLALEQAVGAAVRPGTPGRVARVEDEPSVALRDETVLGLLHLRLGNHGQEPAISEDRLLGLDVPAGRVEPERLDEVLLGARPGARALLAVRPHRLAAVRVASLDLDRRRLRAVDVLARVVGGVEEVRAGVENASLAPLPGEADQDDLVGRVSGRDRDGDRLDLVLEALGLDDDPVLLGQGERERRTRDVAEPDEDRPEAAVLMRPLLGERLCQLVLADEPAVEEDLAERAPAPVPPEARGRRGYRAWLVVIELVEPVAQLDPVLLRKGLRERGAAHRALVDDDLSELLPGAALLAERALQLLAAEQIFVDEKRSELAPREICLIHGSHFRLRALAA